MWVWGGTYAHGEVTRQAGRHGAEGDGVDGRAPLRWLQRAAAVAVAAVAVLGCSAAGPPVEALTGAAADPDWVPGIAATGSGYESRPEVGALDLGVMLRNVTADTELRIGTVRAVDGVGIEVERAGLDPVAERDENALASTWSGESSGMVDSVVLPPQHHVRLRVELRPDCDAEPALGIQATVTDGTTRTEVAIDQLPSPGGPGWIAEALDQHCAAD